MGGLAAFIFGYKDLVNKKKWSHLLDCAYPDSIFYFRIWLLKNCFKKSEKKYSLHKASRV